MDKNERMKALSVRRKKEWRKKRTFDVENVEAIFLLFRFFVSRFERIFSPSQSHGVGMRR
jgi:hypothetical protein